MLAVTKCHQSGLATPEWSCDDWSPPEWTSKDRVPPEWACRDLAEVPSPTGRALWSMSERERDRWERARPG